MLLATLGAPDQDNTAVQSGWGGGTTKQGAG